MPTLNFFHILYCSDYDDNVILQINKKNFVTLVTFNKLE